MTEAMRRARLAESGQAIPERKWNHWRQSDAMMDFFCWLYVHPLEWTYIGAVIFLKRFKDKEGRDVCKDGWCQTGCSAAGDVKGLGRPCTIRVTEGPAVTSVLTYPSPEAMFEDGWELD